VFTHTASDQRDRLSVLLRSHHDQAREIAARTLDNARILDETRARLAEVVRGNAGFWQGIAEVRAVLMEGGEVEPTVGPPTTFPDPWADLLIDPASVPGWSLASQCPPQGDDELLRQLVPPEELADLRAYLDRPMFERLRWTRGDYVVCGVCVLVGLALEMLNLAWRPDSPIDRDGKLRSWFDQKLHHHAPGSPIDYQGPGFGGDLHRVRSPGHDAARFFEAVNQTATGEFRGTTWSYGTPSDVFSHVNQFGGTYPQMDWTAAFANVVAHLFGDFFSTHSLPLPLSSLVYEDAGREFRIFIHDLYKEGFSLRHVAIGSLEFLLAFLAIEVWLWMQHGSAGRKTDPVALKRYEMRSAVTGFLTGANVAGCVVFEDPFLLNVPMLVAAVDSSVRMLQLRAKRDSWVLKSVRNLDELTDEWNRLAAEVGIR